MDDWVELSSKDDTDDEGQQLDEEPLLVEPSSPVNEPGEEVEETEYKEETEQVEEPNMELEM